MHLYFLRHGKAGDRDEWTGSDFDRPLTAAGTDDLRAAALGLRALDVKLDALLSSPLVRAWRTAEIAAAALGLPVTEAPTLAPGCDLDRFAAALKPHRAASALMVVGHEPDFSTLIGLLIARRGAPAAVEMKKGACCRVDISGNLANGDALAGRGTLIWLLTVKQLGGLASGGIPHASADDDG
jgi:phosphohistidine phosphatase